MNNRFEQWNWDLFLALIDDAERHGYQHDPEEYLEKYYKATLAQFPYQVIYFKDADRMLLFQLRYSEYL